MTGTPSALAELLADCDAHGIRLLLAGDDGLAIDAPEDALTPNMLDRLKACKAELVAILRPVPEAAPPLPSPTCEAPTKQAKTVCRCGSTTWWDVSIHGGQSIRRDCGQCRRFIEFPVWYNNNTLQKEK